MKKAILKNVLILLMLAVVSSSCVNLKSVNNFAVKSQKSIKQFEDIHYSFTQSCQDECHNKKIKNLTLDADSCECILDEKADASTLMIYNAIEGYLSGLASLSNDELTDYKFDAVANALKEGDFGSMSINKEHVDAYSKISETLTKAFTDGYRKRKIKEYVTEANEPLKVLISFLDFNLSENLNGVLNAEKEKIKSYYFGLTTDESLPKKERRNAAESYYQELQKIETKQKEIQTYSKALKKISEGHQNLADNIDKMTKAEIKEMLTQYASEIQDIISEFNKLKK